MTYKFIFNNLRKISYNKFTKILYIKRNNGKKKWFIFNFKKGIDHKAGGRIKKKVKRTRTSNVYLKLLVKVYLYLKNSNIHLAVYILS